MFTWHCEVIQELPPTGSVRWFVCEYWQGRRTRCPARIPGVTQLVMVLPAHDDVPETAWQVAHSLNLKDREYEVGHYYGPLQRKAALPDLLTHKDGLWRYGPFKENFNKHNYVAFPKENMSNEN